jgi:hypothetical protein
MVSFSFFMSSGRVSAFEFTKVTRETSHPHATNKLPNVMKQPRHSVVAVGKECKAAGIAQLEIDDRRDLYEGMRDCERKVQNMREDLKKQGDDKEGSKKANIAYYEQQASERRTQLQGWTPPVQNIDTVLIDFDSGHYSPRQAWKEALQAWRTVGYTAKWNPNSRWV